MALSKLWLEVVKEDQSVVEKAISSSIGRFGHTVLRAAQAETVYTRGWRQRPANRNAVYFIIIH